MDASTLYLAALVSQATFALSLSLLAWSDKRTKGVVWLAAACALQFLWTSTVVSGHRAATHVAETIGACLLVVLFSLVYIGFRWFVVRKPLRPLLLASLVLASLVLVIAVAVVNPLLAQNVGRLVAATIGIVTVRMLWTTRITALQTSARVSALAITAVLAIMFTRMLFNQPVERWHSDMVETPLVIREREITVVLVTLLSFSFIGMFVAETNRRLHDETRIDSLTGLRNRRAMEEAAVREVGIAVHRKLPLALLMLDLDHFKDLNDTWGHTQGDRALRSVGAVLMAAVGPGDITARMGGEEFAVLLPGRGLDAAAELAEKMRAMVAELRVKDGNRSASFTVSIGVSVLRDGEDSWADMLCRADDALYQAKRGGRNRVAVCMVGESLMTPEREAGRREWRSSRWKLPKPGPML